MVLRICFSLLSLATVVACGSEPNDVTSDTDPADVTGSDVSETTDVNSGDTVAVADTDRDVVADLDADADVETGGDVDPDLGADSDAGPACEAGAQFCDGDTLFAYADDTCEPQFVGECEFGCAAGVCNEPPNCEVSSFPEVGEWTEIFEPNTDCTCAPSDLTCHALWQGRIVEIDGNEAVLEFRKASDGQGPSVDVDYWVMETPTVTPGCDIIDVATVRETGEWPALLAPLEVRVPIWATQSAYDVAPAGDQVHLMMVSGGGGREHLRTWWTLFPLTFSKSCE